MLSQLKINTSSYSQSAVFFLQTTFLDLLYQDYTYNESHIYVHMSAITSILSKVRWSIATLNTPQNLPFSEFFYLTFGTQFLSCRFSFSFLFYFWEEKTHLEMQLHISPSLRHVTVLPAKGFREFIKVKIGSRRLSYRMLFYSLLFFTFLLRFAFVLTAVDSIDGETKCSSIGMHTISPSLEFTCIYKCFCFRKLGQYKTKYYKLLYMPYET